MYIFILWFEIVLNGMYQMKKVLHAKKIKLAFKMPNQFQTFVLK
jgi:hypothetical protein